MCVRAWTVRLPFILKPFPQIAHTCDFSAKCSLIWLFKLRFIANVASHIVHSKGLSFSLGLGSFGLKFCSALENTSVMVSISWVFTCFANSSISIYMSSQNAQWYSACLQPSSPAAAPATDLVSDSAVSCLSKSPIQLDPSIPGSSCTIVCWRKNSWVQNAASHTPQRYGSSPICCRMCSNRFLAPLTFS